MPLTGDRGLVLKSKAKHAAISVPLKKTFSFVDKPLVVQYEVNLQNGQECGGAYIKVRLLYRYLSFYACSFTCFQIYAGSEIPPKIYI